MKLKGTNEKVNLQISLQNEIRIQQFYILLLKMPMNISVGKKNEICGRIERCGEGYGGKWKSTGVAKK